ncbi:hypothetical protein THAOC_05501, partial [Thalassiosira oceanica]
MNSAMNGESTIPPSDALCSPWNRRGALARAETARTAGSVDPLTETQSSKKLDAQPLRDDVETEKTHDDQAVLDEKPPLKRHVIVIVQPRSMQASSADMKRRVGLGKS